MVIFVICFSLGYVKNYLALKNVGNRLGGARQVVDGQTTGYMLAYNPPPVLVIWVKIRNTKNLRVSIVVIVFNFNDSTFRP